MKLLQLSILIATNTIANASPNEHDGNITQLDDGVGFEEVAENFYRNSGVVDIRSFLRGASAFNSSENLNDLIDFQKFYYEHDDEDDDDNDDPLDIVDDEEDDEDIDSTIVDEIDDGSGRRLQTTPEKVLKTMNNRDKKWLSSHNSRRKMYHNKYGSSYSPLMWSHKLKKKAKKWAKHLASLCGSRGIYHDPANNFGENLASNTGTGSWAKKPSPDSVMTRFVENEEFLPPPQNYHFTQVLWKATEYVGCAEASKNLGNGKMCHIQVCRYARPGNCNMGKYNTWKEPMLMDESPCSPMCPPGGCY